MTRNLTDGARLALGTLTIVPVPPPRVVDRGVGGVAMLLAPVAALPLAAVACAVVLAGSGLSLSPLVTAVAAVGVVVLGSRGLHLDGLADTADGLAASFDRERALTVMRTGDVGPTGVATLVLVLLAQTAALAGAIEDGAATGCAAVATAVVASRSVLAPCCVRGVPSARADGLGAAVVGGVPRTAALLVALLTAGLLTAACSLGPGPLPWWQVVGAVVLGWGAAAALVGHAVRRLGGLTGDVLGACVEITALTALVILSV